MKKEVVTVKGRVVYDRKKHPFSPRDIRRILGSYMESITVEELREMRDNPGPVRALRILSDNLFLNVSDLFPNDVTITEYEEILKKTARRMAVVARLLSAAIEGNPIDLVFAIGEGIGELLNLIKDFENLFR